MLAGLSAAGQRELGMTVLMKCAAAVVVKFLRYAPVVIAYLHLSSNNNRN
jgi:hypothetical protein